MKRIHSVEGVHRRKNEAYIGDKQFEFDKQISNLNSEERWQEYEVSERAHTDSRNSFRTSPM